MSSNHSCFSQFPIAQQLAAIGVFNLPVCSKDRKDHTLDYTLFATDIEHQGRIVNNGRYLAFDLRAHLHTPKRETGPR